MQYTFYAFDTDCILHIPEKHIQSEVEALIIEIQSWHHIFNVFDEKSEVSRFNQSATLFQASEIFYTTLQKMMEYREKTKCYFEPFVETLHFTLREKGEITAESQGVYQNIHQNGVLTFLENLQIEKSHPEIRVNFHSFLKGFACDYMREYLYERLNLRHFLIDFGGNILAEGMESSDAYWCVGIQNPSGVRNEIIEKMDLINESLVTSASYERPIEVLGEKMKSHLINPVDGQFLPYSTYSVSVRSELSAVSDVLSTVLSVCSKEERKAFLNVYQARAYIVENDELIIY